MNPVSQFDVHPDAESLNGFVEHQLPEAERAQVMEHLASCSRCRQIVYLTQDAVPALEERGPAVAGAREEVNRKPRRFGWGFAWATAAACGLIAVLAIFVSTRKTTRPAQMAKALPPVMNSVLSAPMTAPVPAAPPAAVKKSPAPSRQADASRPAAKPHSQPARPAGAAAVGDVSAGVAAAPTAGQPALSQTQEASGKSKSNDETLRLFAAGAGNAAQHRPSLAARGAIHGAAVAPGPNAMAAKMAPATKNEPAPPSESVTVNASADQVLLQPETTGRAQLETIPPPATEVADEKKSGLTMLPSGLPVVSMVAAGRNIVAIDAVGSLFLSADLEKSWEPIKRQWNGRAVKVRVAQAPGAPGANAASPLGSLQGASPRAKTSIAAAVPGAIFELVNDSNAVWASADGKTWKAK
jgi:hypothetical protein